MTFGPPGLLQCFPLILRHFGFTAVICCVVRDDKQEGKPDSQCPPGKIISALRFAQLFPGWFTQCLLHSWICPFHFSRLICQNIHCLFSFDQANLTTNRREAKTNNEKEPETTSWKKPCNVAKENNIIKVNKDKTGGLGWWFGVGGKAIFLIRL